MTASACTLCILLCLPPGQAVERCANDTSIQAVKPCLSIVYAADENFCIEPTTQNGTVVAVLYCLLGQPGRAVLTGHNRRAYRSHSAPNGSTTVFYLTTTGNRSQAAPARDRIALTCETSSAHSNQVVLNISYCSDANQSGAPYLLGIPPSTTVRVSVGRGTNIALFNVIAKVSTTVLCVHNAYMNCISPFYLLWLEWLIYKLSILVHSPCGQNLEFPSVLTRSTQSMTTSQWSRMTQLRVSHIKFHFMLVMAMSYSSMVASP